MNAPNHPSRDWAHAQLCRANWYALLPTELQGAMLEASSIRSFEEGERIVEQGLHSEHLYAVLEGQVAFVRQLPDDREFLLDIAGPGFWFADPSVLLDEPMPHTVVARRKVRTLLIAAARANQIRSESACFATHMSKLHAQRFVSAINTVADAAALPRDQFLRQRLVNLASHAGLSASRCGSVELAISQAELALMIGVSRQTLNGYLADLESQGLLSVRYRGIQLHPSMLSTSDAA